MAIILIVGIIMAVLTCLFWYLELRPFLSRIISPNPESKGFWGALQYIGVMLTNIGLFLRFGTAFIIDVAITIMISGILGLSTGVIGATVALSLSNAISVLILISQLKQRSLA